MFPNSERDFCHHASVRYLPTPLIEMLAGLTRQLSCHIKHTVAAAALIPAAPLAALVSHIYGGFHSTLAAILSQFCSKRGARMTL